jgi:hypothetical protein
MSQGYNGWSNYETWLVNLWFGDIFTEMSDQGQLHSEMLREFVEEMLESDGALPQYGFAADIMNAALRSVDWRELAEHYETEEEEEENQEILLKDAELEDEDA